MNEYRCPACGADIGQPCYVPITGVDTTGWEHDARILAPVIRDLATNPATAPTDDAQGERNG